MAKLPRYIIKNIFFRIIPKAKQLNTNSSFVLAGKCPVCNDYKRRLFLKEYRDHYGLYCHNCSLSTVFEHFVKSDYPSEYNQIREEMISNMSTYFKPDRSVKLSRNSKNNAPVTEMTDVEELDRKLLVYVDFNSFRISEPQENVTKEKIRLKCIEHCEKRKIHKDIYNEYVFFIRGPLKGYIGMPMWDKTKTYLVHIQGLLIFPSSEKESQPKYFFIKDSEAHIEDIPKPIYNQWSGDSTDTVYIAEGTLDGLAYGPQGRAMCGATISNTVIKNICKEYPKRVWCIDNYWIDKEGRYLTEKLLRMGETCFVIPKGMWSKDGNDLLKELDVDNVPKEFIDKNLYTGKLGLAKLKLTR